MLPISACSPVEGDRKTKLTLLAAPPHVLSGTSGVSICLVSLFSECILSERVTVLLLFLSLFINVPVHPEPFSLLEGINTDVCTFAPEGVIDTFKT